MITNQNIIHVKNKHETIFFEFNKLNKNNFVIDKKV